MNGAEQLTTDERLQGPVVKDQDGNAITWQEFCRRVKETIERHEREHPGCERPVFTRDHFHAGEGK